MKKINVFLLILKSIFLVVFNVLFFAINGISEVPSIWISYGFIHFAYLMLLATSFLIRKNNLSVLNISIYGISSGYFFLELITGIVIILIAPFGWLAAMVVQVLMAALYAILLIFAIITNEATIDTDESHCQDLRYVKEVSLILKEMEGSQADQTLKRKLERFYDMVQSSPTISNPAVHEMEWNINRGVHKLAAEMVDMEKEELTRRVEQLYTMAEERNRNLLALQ